MNPQLHFRICLTAILLTGAICFAGAEYFQKQSQAMQHGGCWIDESGKSGSCDWLRGSVK